MTAEQFIKSHFKGIEKETWFPAMVVFSEEYAEQQAIEFAEWIRESYFKYGTMWIHGLTEKPIQEDEIYTTEQLYQKFKEEQK